LKEERDQLREQIAQSEERIENLQSTLSQPFDEEYIIKYAREKLNYRLPEEIVLEHDGNVISFYYSAMNYDPGIRLS
jgi:cell division protein FtsB